MNLPLPLIDPLTSRELLRVAVPQWEEFLECLESAKGRLRFRSGLTKAIKNLNIQNYPLLYENERAIGSVLVKAFMSDEEARAFDAELRAASDVERGAMLREFGNELQRIEAALDFPETPEAEALARTSFEAMSAEAKAEAVRFLQLLLAGVLALFYEQLSIMVHGEKLTALVAQAKAGDDRAYAKAVQIDGRVLTAIPYFRERHDRARMEDEKDFLASVWRRQVAAPYKGRIEHKSLWLTFAFLDSVGLLRSFNHGELLDLCDELGVGGQRRRIEDVKNLSKRLAEFRRFQKRRHLSTP